MAGKVVDNSTIVVESISNITALLPTTSQAALVSPLRGSYKVLFIITQFNGGKPTFTKQQVEQRIFAPARQFFNNCSYGRVRLDPLSRVVGPVSIGPRAGCPGDSTAEQWIITAMTEVQKNGRCMVVTMF